MFISQGGQMSETFVRQWKILKMIPRHPRTIDSLAIRGRLQEQGIGAVNLRAIQRDLEMLSQVFPLAVADPEKRPIGWFWPKDAQHLQLPGLEPSEAVALKLVHTYLKPLLPTSMLDALKPHLSAADEILGHTGKLGPGRWIRSVRMTERTQCFAHYVLAQVYKVDISDKSD